MEVRRIVTRYHAVAIILLLPVVVLASALAGQNKRPMQLPFRLSHGVAIEIEGRIGRLNNLRFFLDTGTTKTVVDRRVAHQLHLSCKPGNTVINFNRRLKMEQCVLPDIGIGSFHVKDLPVYVTTLALASRLADDADALIGLDLLGASRFTLDYATYKVTFDSIKRPAPPPANDPDDPICMTAVIQVQGHPLRLILDTGIQGIVLYRNRLRNSFPHLRVAGKSEYVNIGGRLPAKRVTLTGVRIGGVETNLVALLISEPPKNILPGIDGFLGVSELRARQVTIDFVAKTLTLKR